MANIVCISMHKSFLCLAVNAPAMTRVMLLCMHAVITSVVTTVKNTMNIILAAMRYNSYGCYTLPGK